MNPTVLVTGGSGLLALNWALAMRSSNTVTLGFHHREVALADVKTRKIDLESVDGLVRELEVINPQVVVHAAGLTNVEECENNPQIAQHINVELAVNIAQACARSRLPLIHISTDHLFTGESPLVDENGIVAPVNVYARTKAEAEHRVRDAHPQALVIRTNFYGWGTSYRRSFSDFIIEMLRSGKQLTLFKDIFYTPILIEALVQTVHELVDLHAEGIFNVVGDERISKYDFGLRIAERFNLDADLIRPGLLGDMSMLVQRPFDMSLSNQKACTILQRKLGGTVEHINRLYAQEQSGLTKEIKSL